MHHSRLHSTFLVGLVAGILAVSACMLPAKGQTLVRGPVVSLEDPAAVFGNPAVLAFQRARLAVGARAYHLGLANTGGVPLKQGLMAISAPYLIAGRAAAGAQVQYFNSPIYNRTSFGLAAASRVFGFASVGVELAAFNQSYNQSNFVEFDLRDPVFAGGFSKTVLTFSAGVYAQPLPELSLGAGIRNMNQPDLSLVDAGVPLNAQPFIGVGYAMGPVRALLEWSKGPYGNETRFGVEALSVAGSFVRLTSNGAFDRGGVAGQLHVGGPLSVHYAYELPFSGFGGSTSGSHTLGLIVEFGRAPDLPEPNVLPPFVFEPAVEEVPVAQRPQFYLTASADYLRYYEQQIIREVDDDIHPSVLQQLSRYDAGVMDSSYAEVQDPRRLRALIPLSEATPLSGTYARRYEQSLQKVAQKIGEDPSQQFRIVGNDADLHRATGIRNHLVRAGSLDPSNVRLATPEPANGADPSLLAPAEVPVSPLEQRLVLEPRATTLYFLASYSGEDAIRWEVLFEDADGNPVRSFTGEGPVPEALEWNWRDQDGNVIEPGVYRYRLRWQDSAGRWLNSNNRTLYVQKFLRKITVRVTRDASILGEPSDTIELRINH